MGVQVSSFDSRKECVMPMKDHDCLPYKSLLEMLKNKISQISSNDSGHGTTGITFIVLFGSLCVSFRADQGAQ